MTAAERAWVADGGILWYNMQPHNWSQAASGDYDATIERHAAAVKSLAPAQVIVNAGHEPDHHCEPGATEDYYGTPAEYRRMWARFRSRFKAAGVDNAVWAMDYSRAIMDKFDLWADALWPGDGEVDWLFFNAFGNKPEPKPKGNFTAILSAIYANFEAGTGPGHNYTALPWGIGAFAPNEDSDANKIEYMTQAAAAANSSGFARIRAWVYYGRDGVSASVRPAYRAYLSSPRFTGNDAAWVPVGGAELSACDSADAAACFGNGICNAGKCLCDTGWMGPSCDRLRLESANTSAHGYANNSNPVWGGTAVARLGLWHLFMGGTRAVLENSKRSHIIRAISRSGPSGPYEYAEEIRASHEERLGSGGLGLRADVHEAPNGSLVLFTAAALDGLCGLVRLVSPTGDPSGPWLPSLAFHKRENASTRWDCGFSDPSATIRSDGSLLVAYRTNYGCAGQPLEHVGLLRAPRWDADASAMEALTTEASGPLFTFNASNEDPFLWWSHRGVHMLLHSQASPSGVPWPDHKTRGALAFAPISSARDTFSLDGGGLHWRLSTSDAWGARIDWSNGTSLAALRRQRPSLIFEPGSWPPRPTHFVCGVNFVDADFHKTTHDQSLVQALA